MVRDIPLKLKWGKKSGRYDLNQDIYVLTVSVGERPFIQCTLTTHSTALQCIQYISQKTQLNQIEMFGFRYQMRSQDPDQRLFRWVEMEKPLRRQLDKWACKPRQVQLAVLYHTPNAFTLTDQMARSFYFALMKLDVVEGRLTVDMEKYISLAAYSLQVEFGAFDENVHTVDFMQTIPLLPKQMCRSAQILEDILKRVIVVYKKLRDMQPDKAALCYIVDAIQSEGYGEEYFKAKDEDSSEVMVGYSPDGIVVRGFYGAPIKYIWKEIRDILASKRHLQLKLNDGRCVEYTLEDTERCRYVAMVLNWQSRYANSKAIEEKNAPLDIKMLQGAITGIKTLSNGHLGLSSTELNSTRSDHIHTEHSTFADNGQFPPPDRELSSISFRSGLNEITHPRKPTASISFSASPNQISFSRETRMADIRDALRNTRNSQHTGSTLSRPEPIGRPLSELPSGQKKIMGSTPEMRVLGIYTDSNGPKTNGENNTPASFQSTPNLKMKEMDMKYMVRPHKVEQDRKRESAEIRQSNEDDMVALFSQKLNGPLEILRTEFSRIPNKRLSAGTSTSLKPENMNRNRTRAIVPYEDNRVTLRPHKNNPTGYINASNVEITIGARRLQYILTQAPLKETIEDFWQMIWEQRVHVIVMLNEAKVDSHGNSPIYWPLNGSSRIETREVVVKYKNINTAAHEVTTCLEVKNIHSGEKRTIYHLRYLGWQSGECPPDEYSILNFMDSVNSVHRHVDNERARQDSCSVFGRISSSSTKRSRSSSRKNIHDISNKIRSQSTDSVWKRRVTSSVNGTSTHSSASSVDSTDSGAPSSPRDPSDSPIVIHCHSGAHESGVYLLAEVAQYCLEHNMGGDISTVLGQLRGKRMSLVKTVEQYRFVYALLATHLNQSRLI